MNLYFTALVLPEELNVTVLRWKQYMFAQYGCKVGSKSLAHITILAPFWMEEQIEDQLLLATDEISKTTPQFCITTNDFSAFRPRTIFIDVQHNSPLSHLKKASDDYLKQRTVFNAKIDNRLFHPHITIATRDIYKKIFYKAWNLFEPKPFREEWTAEGLSVLRHNKKAWDVIYTSLFKQ